MTMILWVFFDNKWLVRSKERRVKPEEQRCLSVYNIAPRWAFAKQRTCSVEVRIRREHRTTTTRAGVRVQKSLVVGVGLNGPFFTTIHTTHTHTHILHILFSPKTITPTHTTISPAQTIIATITTPLNRSTPPTIMLESLKNGFFWDIFSK